MKDLIQSQELPLKLILFIAIIVSSSAVTYFYRQFAIQHGIIAKINFRTLHSKIVPRGGGVGFGLLFSVLVLGAWLLDVIPIWLMLSLGLGGFAAVFIGFIDDIYEITALKKLLSHFCLSLYFFLVFFNFQPFPFSISTDIFLFLITVGIWLFIPLWAVNTINFIDGIDGLAISSSIFICISMVIVLSLTGGDQILLITFSLLAATSLGFAMFNMPPASIFMGDSGSIFLGFFLGCSILITVYFKQISIWTWIASLSYILADTMTTTISRIFLVKKWYGVHRSHAYQNLARIKKSHAKVTFGIILYNLLWALPLSVWCALRPQWGPFAGILALLPAVIWSMRFGPRFSSD